METWKWKWVLVSLGDAGISINYFVLLSSEKAVPTVVS